MKIFKIVFLVVMCLISYTIGWGNGQKSAYDKIETAPSLMDLYSK